MQSMQIQPKPTVRRWCRECGLPSPSGAHVCVHCGQTPSIGHTTRNLSPIFNDGNGMVQNNVLNLDLAGLLSVLDDDQPVVVAPQSSLLHRAFLFTCTIGMWVGIICFLTIVTVIVVIVVLAFMKAHG